MSPADVVRFIPLLLGLCGLTAGSTAKGDMCSPGVVMGFYPSQSEKRLEVHIVATKDVVSEELCHVMCFVNAEVCRSINFNHTKGHTGQYACEVNNSTATKHPGDLQKRAEFSYRETKDPCASNPCKGNKTCQPRVGPRGYQCVCPAGYGGDACKDVDECAEPSTCDANASCKNSLGSYLCMCNTGFGGNGTYCELYFNQSDSKILEDHSDHVQKLLEYLAPVQVSGKRWRLCFRASDNGSSALAFHAACDNKGPTVTLVRVRDNVFGGYTDKSWDGNEEWISSDKAFLFSLKNRDDKEYKMAIYQSKQAYAMYSSNHYGPTFGWGRDLYISSNVHIDSFSDLGHTYKLPDGYKYGDKKAKSLLAGSFKFTFDAYEVFYQQAES